MSLMTHHIASRLRAILVICMASALCLMSKARAEESFQLHGYVAAKTADCLNPACKDHAPNYYLYDEKSGERVHIKGYDKHLEGIPLLQKISIKGVRRDKATRGAARERSGKPTQAGATGTGADLEIKEFEVLPVNEEAGLVDELEPIAESGANSLTMLSTLLVFISTNTHGCMTSETNARNRLFNNTTNANEGMQAITKGRYGLQLGNGTGVPQDHVINLTLNVNSADHNTDSIETLALNKLFNDSTASGGLRLDRRGWNRILLFAPAGITDSGFTAYAYYPWGIYSTHGLVSMYGNSYGNNRMNGYLHELGHNFGFNHSSKGGSEYGDRTCVMGVSNNATRTETYNVAKLLEKDWLDVFPNAQLSVTTDTTIDLYPLSSDPNVVDEAIAVDFPGTAYYAAYHRNQEPYGYLSQVGERDKVFVYSRATGDNQKSFQVANIARGGSYSGPGTVHFERYGPNNEYATVSFDMDDGNAKPVANTQSINVTINTPQNIILSGSDGDDDILSYTKVTNPTNGVLSGTTPNLTYTPNSSYLGSDSFVFKISDGKISSFATITITVNPALPENYTAWVNAGGFTQAFTDINPTANPDGDLMSNLMEFALGTDPTLQDSKSLVIDGSVNGLPLPVNAGGGVFEYYFVRRKDHGTSGSVSYTVQFSDDLSGFTNSAVSPSFVVNSSANGNYELVKVPFPSARRFGRLQIEPVP